MTTTKGHEMAQSKIVQPDMPPLYDADQMRAYGDARAAAAVLAERERWKSACKSTWGMVDPLHPAGVPGSYARGNYQGIVDALTTINANYEASIRAEPKEQQP